MDNEHGSESEFEYEHDDAITDDDDNEQQPVKKRTRGETTLKNFKVAERIIEFNELGQAIGPNQYKFGSSCKFLSARVISICYDDWRKVPGSEKEKLWSQLKDYWNIPNDSAKIQVLRQCNERWKAFKLRLRLKYMLKEKTPFKTYTFLEENKWRQFVAQESTEEKRLKREKGIELANLKKNPPRLGPKGYRGNISRWRAEAKCAKTSTPVHELPCTRARHYLLGRTSLENGVRVVPPEIQEKVKKLALLSQSNTEFAPGSDLLTLVEGKEHNGRTRGVGSTIGLKKGIPGNDKKKRKKRETVKELREKFQNMEREHREEMQAMKCEHDQLKTEFAALKSMQQGSTLLEEDIPLFNSRPIIRSYDSDSHLDQSNIVGPTQRKSTQAKVSDVPVVKERHTKIDSATASYLEPLNKLKEPTKCALIPPNVPKQTPCAIGMVFPIVSGMLLHGKPLTTGYMKVQVDTVIKGYGDLELPSPMEGFEKLNDARNTFIEWPKTRIRFLKPSKGSVTTTSTSVNEGTTTEASKEAKKITSNSYLPSTIRSSATMTTETSKEAKKITSNSYLPSSTGSSATMLRSVNKVTCIKPSKQANKTALKSYSNLEKHREFIYKEKPFFIRAFYDRWMERPNPGSGVVLSLEKIFGPSVCKDYVVGSDDLMCLLTDNWLDISVITYFTMSLHTNIQAKDENRCALLNPFEILGLRCVNEMTKVGDYLFDAINNRNKGKTIFLAPFYENLHWVLFIIWPYNKTVYILDSLMSKRKLKNEESYSLATPLALSLGDIHWILAECPQQKGDWECGFYVMLWMYKFIENQKHFPQTIPWENTKSYGVEDLNNIVGLWLSYFMKTCKNY